MRIRNAYIDQMLKFFNILDVAAGGGQIPGRVQGNDRAICRAITSPLRGSDNINKSSCIQFHVYIHTTREGKIPMETLTFILCSKRGFSGVLEVMTLKIFPWGIPQAQFLSFSLVIHHNACS